MTWRTQSFPWFDDMMIILGESLATGKYSFHGGDISDEDEFNDENDESLVEPSLRTISQPSTRPATPRPGTANSQSSSVVPMIELDDMQDSNVEEDEVKEETATKKRHRESSSLQPSKAPKKTKVSGLAAMEKMSAGIEVIASTYSAEVSSMKNNQESVSDTLQGQAQDKIQEEGRMTVEGQLVMLELLADTTLARTYLAIKKDELRVKWIKKQLEKQSRDINEFFIDWEETQHS
jgi:hypothetical protein